MESISRYWPSAYGVVKQLLPRHIWVTFWTNCTNPKSEASINAKSYLRRRFAFLFAFLAAFRCAFSDFFIAFRCFLFAFFKNFCCFLAAARDWRAFSSGLTR